VNGTGTTTKTNQREGRNALPNQRSVKVELRRNKILVYITKNQDKLCMIKIKEELIEDFKKTKISIDKNEKGENPKDFILKNIFWGYEYYIVWINREMNVSPEDIKNVLDIKIGNLCTRVRVMPEGRGGHYFNKCLYEVGIR
jgi:hypothetical protein